MSQLNLHDVKLYHLNDSEKDIGMRKIGKNILLDFS